FSPTMCAEWATLWYPDHHHKYLLVITTWSVLAAAAACALFPSLPQSNERHSSLRPARQKSDCRSKRLSKRFRPVRPRNHKPAIAYRWFRATESRIPRARDHRQPTMTLSHPASPPPLTLPCWVAPDPSPIASALPHCPAPRRP